MNPYLHDTDETLVALLLQGNERAFDAIYFRYAKDLYRYAAKTITIKADAQEIIQDVFESLWTRHAQLSHITKLDSYLFRMVKYKMIRYFQHSKVKQKYVDHFLVFEALYDTSQEGEREIENLRTEINQTLERLPERCQTVVRLRIDENLSNTDIAKLMGVEKSTVKRYMTEALGYFKGVHRPIYKGDGVRLEPE